MIDTSAPAPARTAASRTTNANPPAVFVIGDSHTGALQRGLDLLVQRRPEDARLAALRVKPFGPAHLMCEPFFERAGSSLAMLPPAFRQRVPRIPTPDVAPGTRPLHALCAPLHTARVFRSLDWQRFDPPGVDAGGAPVSAAMMARLVDDDQRHVKDFVEALQAIELPLVVMEPPRPFAHHPTVQAVGAAKVVAIDAFYRGRMRAWLAGRGIGVVDIPPESVAPDGLMHAEYRNPSDEDQHHGSPQFGAIMIDRLLASTAVR